MGLFLFVLFCMRLVCDIDAYLFCDVADAGLRTRLIYGLYQI